jgi:hypothetical protein
MKFLQFGLMMTAYEGKHSGQFAKVIHGTAVSKTGEYMHFTLNNSRYFTPFFLEFV